jgi:hypothetical protein
VVELPSGPHVIDVVASISALVPEDPISHGVLNGLLKDNGNWAPLIQHWKMARAGLRRLTVLAQSGGAPQVVLRRHDEIRGVHDPDGIDSLDIRECEAIGADPTCREVMEQQFGGSPPDPARQGATSPSRNGSHEAQRTDDRIIVLRPFQHAQLSYLAPEPQAKSTTEPTSASGCASPTSDIPE